MSVSEVYSRYRYLLYSKHNDVYNGLLEDEIALVENALKEFVIQLGNISGDNKNWEAICVGLCQYYIAFREVGKEEWELYDDLKELDRRYVDYAIDQFLEIHK